MSADDGDGLGGVRSHSCFRDIDGNEANDERDGGEDFEVDERLEAETSDGAEFSVAGDAGDERAENERSDDDFDEPEKNVAEDLGREGDARCVEAELDAGQHAEKDPSGKRAFAQSGNGQKQQADHADNDAEREMVQSSTTDAGRVQDGSSSYPQGQIAFTRSGGHVRTQR